MKKILLVCLIAFTSSASNIYGAGSFFEITRIPHGLSMAGIQQQEAVANTEFHFNFKKVVNYYEENAALGVPPQGIIDQTDLYRLEHLGLHFHADDLSITGIPNKTGVYTFKIGAKNKNSSTNDLATLTLNIERNLKDKPVFKENHTIASAAPEKKYSLNLMSLLKENADFTIHNQVVFKIDNSYSSPSWLYINPENPSLLEGIPDKDSAGKKVTVTLVATSNTGGDSSPFTISIPIAFDPEKKPAIGYFEMNQLAGNQFYINIAHFIHDPANDPNLKVIIDKIEPENTGLKIASPTPKVLEGFVPESATGQKYLITLQASTTAGGTSDPITIPLQINIDKSRTPQFKEDNPTLPLVYPGQKFFHDFVENRDVFPEYEDAPYTLEFAKDYQHPEWLKLENNKLFSENIVPDKISDSRINIKLVIKNIPGGASKPIPLYLKVIN